MNELSSCEIVLKAVNILFWIEIVKPATIAGGIIELSSMMVMRILLFLLFNKWKKNLKQHYFKKSTLY